MVINQIMLFNRIMLFCYLWIFVINGVLSQIFTPVVEVSQGKLQGLRSVSGQNRYYGIPYAESRRFQEPTPPAKWEGIFSAVNRLNACAQAISLLHLGEEDCLRLDVYAPEWAKPTDRLPVLVFIHGGAYYYGTRTHYDPEFLVTKNTVAVIINYRVGVFGFLCLNEVSNLGLRDQVAALKWIKKNIAVFGGDPDNVTISGQSAGASAAALHFLSEKSKGLFHKAILMSGTPLAPWALNVEPRKPAFDDAKKMGDVKTEIDVFNLFNNATVEELLSTCHDTSINPRYFKYSPCMDSDFKDPFFKDAPFNLISSGKINKVPIMLGYTGVEGMLFYGLHDDRTFNEWDQEFDNRIPSVFSWCSKKDLKTISTKLRNKYFGKNRLSRKMVKPVMDFYSDWLAYSNVDAFSKLMSEVSDKPVYKYVFNYEGERNFAKFIFGSTANMTGASHSDDIFYVFKPAGLSLLLTSKDKLFIDRLTTMVTNFMRYGNPTPKPTRLLPHPWLPTTANRSRALVLDDTMAMTSQSLHSDFFYDLLCTYGQKGYVPCESKEMCQKREE